LRSMKELSDSLYLMSYEVDELATVRTRRFYVSVENDSCRLSLTTPKEHNKCWSIKL
jgi:hypothetical protein